MEYVTLVALELKYLVIVLKSLKANRAILVHIKSQIGVWHCLHSID